MLNVEGGPGTSRDIEKPLAVHSVDLTNDQEMERRGAIHAPRCGCDATRIAQIVLILIALPTFVVMPLTVNWSVVVNVPPEAEFTRVTVGPRSQARRSNTWYGVKLDYQPGTTTLYVEQVFDEGLASVGVLPGDIVARGVQRDEHVFIADDFRAGDDGRRLMEEVMCFINTPPKKELPCKLEVLDADQSLQVDFDMAHVDVSKGDAYLTVGIIFLRNVFGAIVSTPIALACSFEDFRRLFSSRTIRMLMVLGVGRALAHIFEILANGKINAALFAVVSQSRLVGVAALARLLLGAKQTTLQVLLLTSISIIIVCYVQVPDRVPVSKYWNGFGQPRDPDADTPEVDDSLGIVYAILKTVFTVLIGVIGQKILQDPALKESSMVALQTATFIVTIIPLLPVTLLYMWATHWPHGLVGGSVVEFRHCLKDWDASRCAEVKPVAQVEQGWDYRTVVVLFMYTISEPIVNMLVRTFSALSKDLLNCTATVATYFFGIVALGRQFNFTKCGLAVAVVVQVVQYTLAPKHEESKSSQVRVEPKTGI